MLSRMMLRTALVCVGLMIVFTQATQAAEPGDKPSELYFPVTNLNVPILQNGKSKGTLLFNFLVELNDSKDRVLISRYTPKIKAGFFDELYKFAATLKEGEKVQLEKIKEMLTVVVKKIVGEKKIKGVLVKDFRRAYVK